jgi:hypothetical protein
MTHCRPILKKIKDYDTNFYIHVYEILLHIKMYLSRFKTNSMFHAHDTRNMSDILQIIYPNYLNKVSLTLACLFITTYLMKLRVLMCIMKFKKIFINFLIEKSFHSVQEFMTTEC